MPSPLEEIISTPGNKAQLGDDLFSDQRALSSFAVEKFGTGIKHQDDHGFSSNLGIAQGIALRQLDVIRQFHDKELQLSRPALRYAIVVPERSRHNR